MTESRHNDLRLLLLASVLFVFLWFVAPIIETVEELRPYYEDARWKAEVYYGVVFGDG